MQRRQFLKAALGTTLLPFIPIPIPAPAAPKKLTLEVIQQAVKNIVEKEDLMPTPFGHTPVFGLGGLYKRYHTAGLV